MGSGASSYKTEIREGLKEIYSRCSANDHIPKLNEAFRDDPDASEASTSGIPIMDASMKIVGHAPLAPRPCWLPKQGPGQRNVDPLRWSISVEQWIFFVRACVATSTWKELAKAKGEYNITMYDVNTHFVKPWTQGTGCSIALLMNTVEGCLPVEGMFSHAWGGSVVESYNCLQNMVNHMEVPPTDRFFFCTFSMYQPEDNAPAGLSINEQIEMEPFARIIESEPKHGILIIHTTLSEVYDRLWVAHEADEGIGAQVSMRGLFDMYRWIVKEFERVSSIKTKEGTCGCERDRIFIDGLIMQRGGYERLDEAISEFRKSMAGELEKLLMPHGTRSSGGASDLLTRTERTFDWEERKDDQFDQWDGEEEDGREIRWVFSKLWHARIEQLHARYATNIYKPAAFTIHSREKKDRDMVELANDKELCQSALDILQSSMWSGYPLGARSYVKGPPRYSCYSYDPRADEDDKYSILVRIGGH